ncbi:oligosaccharide biosynthesis protein Alg14 like-domain-containing protein [Nemania sp. NC0429]|nr:oligosaccharide biosynthesis protein Alg14 like-domain-containing protein [Nemania sp. NC0429]
MASGTDHNIGPSEDLHACPQPSDLFLFSSPSPPQQLHPPTHKPIHHPQDHKQEPTSHINQPHKESLIKMNTNRDQAVQNLIGGSIVELIKGSIFLLTAFGIAFIIHAIVLKLMGRPLMNAGGALLGVVTPLLFMAGLVFAAGAGMVRGNSSHYVLMVCGSGGHTAEMIQMVERSIRPEKSSHRRWAVGKDDEKSYNKILAFEQRLLDRFSRHSMDSGTFDIVRFGRARHVHQSWLTTPFTAILSLLDIFHILTTSPQQQPNPTHYYPGVVVTNGPGTGFLFLSVAQVLRFAHLVPKSHMRTIYVESWARVKSLSLTGKLIRGFKLADRFIVQSPLLAGQNETLAENMLVMPQKPQVPF